MTQNMTPKLLVEHVPTSALHLDPANARKHGPKSIAAIKASLQRFGQQKVLVVNSENVVVAGNGTLVAARELGWESIDVVRTSLTGADLVAFAIADNRTAELSEWDDDALARLMKSLQGTDAQASTGFNASQCARMFRALETTNDVDDAGAGAEPAAPVSQRGDLWELDGHRLLCGDSTSADDVAQLMNGELAECVFTSPPYAVGIDYGDTYTDSIENLRAMLPKLAALWIEHVVDGGFAVVNFGDIISGRVAAATDGICEYPMALEYWPAFRSAGWSLWSRRVWCKPVSKVAAPWCASSNRSATNFEHVWTWKRDGDPIVGRISQPFDSQTGWFDTTKLEGVDVGKEVHGAGMPTSCAVWMINVHSNRGAVVLEPFCGTGTTIVAAEQLARRCFAMEISPAYVDIAVLRWQRATGKVARCNGLTYEELALERGIEIPEPQQEA